MSDPRHYPYRPGPAICAAIFFLMGTVLLCITVPRLYALSDPWGSNSPHWGGFFMGVLVTGLGCVCLWDALFAPPRTPEQEHFRQVNEDWQEERRRIFGNGS